MRLRGIPAADWFCEQCQEEGSQEGEAEVEAEDDDVGEQEEEHAQGQPGAGKLHNEPQQQVQVGGRPAGMKHPSGVFARTLAGKMHRTGSAAADIIAAAARPQQQQMRQPHPPPRLVQLPLTGWGTANSNGNNKGKGGTWGRK